MSAVALSAPDFVARWRGTRLSERSVAHQHFLDLCALLRHPTPVELDPRGEFFTLEKRVTTLDGTPGFADAWKRDHFAWEYKTPGKSLTDAYKQLLDYREPLENPPLLVVCDIARFEVHTNFTGTPKRVHRFTNGDLIEPEPLQILSAAFEKPAALRPDLVPVDVTTEAAARFAGLSDRLRARQIEPLRAAHFLTQLLFCLFAEDLGLLMDQHDRRKIFTDLLRRGVERPDRFTRNVVDLFRAMRDGGELYIYDIPHFNGGLFATIDPVELDREEIATLVELAAYDWSTINTAIMGTLFERSFDPSQRSRLGAHYTDGADILRIVEPVVIEPLRREWTALRTQLDGLIRREASPSPTSEHGRKKERKARSGQQTLIAGALLQFKERLSQVRVLDPAAGSGNFLAVTLTELLALEKEVIVYGALAGLPYMLPEVSPRQLHGLEINPYAHELAQVAVWITYLQWLHANGFRQERRPYLQTLDTIRLQDALLDRSNPTVLAEASWPEVDFIVGNPPFLGAKKLRNSLGDEYAADLFRVFGDRIPGMSDLVCYFFEKARALIAGGVALRAGLVATNSIRGGASRRVLDRVKASGDIFMAWDDEPWVLDGANVRISLVGFDDGKEATKSLDGISVATINSDLTAATNLASASTLRENIGVGFMGDVKAGKFELTSDIARRWSALPLNPNGHSNSEVLRPWINALDITRRPRDLWIIDFGVNMPEREAALYEVPFEYVRQAVKPLRDQAKRDRYRNFWWLHAEPVTAMRRALASLKRYIATPVVSKYRVFAWVRGDVLPDHALIVFARDDDYFFGVLHSRAHEVWSLRMCTWLGVGNDPRYTPTTTFETFPLPWPPGTELTSDSRVASIAVAAQILVTRRDSWLNPPGASEAELKQRTLTNLYNQRPSWLDHAHRELDCAVLDAYGWPHNLSDDDLLARLLALNAERANARPATPHQENESATQAAD